MVTREPESRSTSAANLCEHDRFRFIYTSTSLMRTPPIDPKTGKRRTSYCVVSEVPSTSFKDATHIASDQLGQGSYGVVKLLKPLVTGQPSYAVKVFAPEVNFHADKKDQDIRDFITTEFRMMLREARFNEIYYPYSAVYQVDAPLQIVKSGNTKVVVSHPRLYLLIEYIKGVIFHNYQVTSGLGWLLLCMETLAALEALHRSFMHLDIKGDNVFVCQNDEGHLWVRFIDFGASRFSKDEPIVTKYYNLQVKPPEYSQHDEIAAHASLDVWCTGRILQGKFNDYQQKYAETTQGIVALLAAMRAVDPAARPGVSEALQQCESLLRNDLIRRFREEKKDLLRRFPDVSSIDKWLYCERYLCDLATIAERDRLHCAVVGYEKVTRIPWIFLWQDDLGALRFKECLAGGNATLSASLAGLSSGHRKLVLDHLLKDTQPVANLDIVKVVADYRDELALQSRCHWSFFPCFSKKNRVVPVNESVMPKPPASVANVPRGGS